ncbi:hypothetical protein SCUCBS95973_006319 [Sporothrix curviconia]|uniref:Uncharacterized protein n=1 Tax=Sporothrix curviconia TaxID=1260050 RepID=A0ABP0C477_9PEZI
MIDEVSTPDAVIYGNDGGADGIRGSTAFAESRPQSWAIMSRRRHAAQRVFGSSDAQERVVIGTLDMTLINGKQMLVPFTSHIELAGPRTDAPRIQTMTDPTPIIAALQPAD